MDRRIRLRHIQAFAEIVRQGSLKRAAEVLYLTQPAISRTIAELEEIVGARLLSRSRRGVSLTPQGEFFHGHALNALGALTQGLAGIGGQADPGLALLVGALPSVSARLMPDVVAELQRVAPHLRLSIADGGHGHLTTLLRAGDLDVVIGRLGAPETMQGLSFTQLYLEDVAVVVRPGHPILDDPDLRRIAEFPVLYPPRTAAIHPLVERLLLSRGIAPPPRRIETVSGAFGRVHVRQSDAVWFISAGVVAREIADGRLVRLPLDTELTKGPVGLMTRASQPETSAQLLFRQAVMRVVAPGFVGPSA
ncbi:LysR family transcriptional regulator, pca operon transcriptional activator [Paracoccus solventivorans]|uniref:LysR family transcriptional regulator, pca operon transcriptional activator n=1 Tax=Paracoccus solventivorans TaxID=53463 RepID=A0A1M7JIF8_9RHOB|nr:pca operon transcription factor PcaQ [Paracoccus solventivorans]SHM52738.1 LysR family transcriptional regulator, pca operon transcriptional activator [Paracoccus solventivorans]